MSAVEDLKRIETQASTVLGVANGTEVESAAKELVKLVAEALDSAENKPKPKPKINVPNVNTNATGPAAISPAEQAAREALENEGGKPE